MNKITLKLIVIFGILSENVLSGMQVPIKTNDNKEYKIPRDLALQSEIIKGLFPEEIQPEVYAPEIDPGAEIHLSQVSAKQWEIIESLFKNINDEKQLKKDIAALSTNTLIMCIPALDFLNIPTILDHAFYEFAHRITENPTLVFKKHLRDLIDNFPAHAQYAIAKEILKIGGFFYSLPFISKTLEPHEMVISIAWSHGGNYLASGLGNGKIQIWDTKTWQLVKEFIGHKYPIYSLSWSLDDDYLASGSGDRTIRIWDKKDFNLVKELSGHKGSINSLAWSQDYLASGSGDKTIRIWNIKHWQQEKKLRGHTKTIQSVAWSRDGNYLASGSGDKTIRIWDTKTFDLVHELTDHKGTVFSVRWSDDYFASGSADSMIRIWDIKNWQQIRQPTGHTDPVFSLAWSPDGNYLASGSYDNFINIWNIKRWNSVQEIVTGHKANFSLAWSPKGNYLASGSRDKTIKIWFVEFPSINTLSIKQAIAILKMYQGQALNKREKILYNSLPQAIRNIQKNSRLK